MITAIGQNSQPEPLPDWRQSLRDAVTDPAELLALAGDIFYPEEPGWCLL